MKTDLGKIFTITGEPGLFTYIAQAAGSRGAILESIVTKKRLMAGPSAKMSALTDISIYTDDDEVKLQEVLQTLRDYLKEDKAPSGKLAPQEYIAFFDKAFPSYDKERFYPSHMRKVCEWYNCLKEFASLDFLSDEEREEQANQEHNA